MRKGGGKEKRKKRELSKRMKEGSDFNSENKSSLLTNDQLAAVLCVQDCFI